MEKATDPSLFVNDGSFMERFKQLQQQKEKEKEREKHVDVGQPKSTVNISGKQTPKLIIGKSNVAMKNNEPRKTSQSASGGKLAFSLKQKSKLVAPPVILGEDEDEEGKETGNSSDDGPAKRQKLGNPDSSTQPSRQVDVAPPSPSDATVKKVADKLASFVAKNGRQFEDITRQKNPGDTPFKFLFDRSCSDYKYYEYRLSEEEKSLSESSNSTQKKESRDSRLPQSGSMNTAASNATNISQKSYQYPPNYQIPASALYESKENARTSTATIHPSSTGESSTPNSADPIAMMEYYMKKAAQEEKLRPPKPSKDEMPPPASLQAHGKKGHHMGDYIPPEELEKFLASCTDATAQKVTTDAGEKARIQADNIGHKLLSKMGWKEGEGLGSSRSGISDPIMAGGVKQNNLGVGASNPGEVNPDDDIYEQYKKRMMLGYRYRPNPLNNPRKAYY